MRYAFFQGNIVPFNDAKISIMNHAFNYGTGVFEGIRAYWNETQNQLFLLKAREHFERLQRSAWSLKMNLKKEKEKKQVQHETSQPKRTKRDST